MSSRHLKRMPHLPNSPRGVPQLHAHGGPRPATQQSLHAAVGCLRTAAGAAQGLRHEYYLRVEEMDLWYPSLIQLLDLGPSVSTGWNQSRNASGGRVQLRFKQGSPLLLHPCRADVRRQFVPF